jgi:hypothetical protein
MSLRVVWLAPTLQRKPEHPSNNRQQTHGVRLQAGTNAKQQASSTLADAAQSAPISSDYNIIAQTGITFRGIG